MTYMYKKGTITTLQHYNYEQQDTNCAVCPLLASFEQQRKTNYLPYFANNLQCIRKLQASLINIEIILSLLNAKIHKLLKNVS